MLTNANKMQFIWLGARQHLVKVSCHSANLHGIDFQPSTNVTSLKVVFDIEMNFAKHI